MKELRKHPTILVFALLIAVVTFMDILSPMQAFSDMENRLLAQRPAFTLSALLGNQYTSSYETYVNDQFVLRNSWISLKSLTEALLGKIENNGIVYGKDNYLFEKIKTLDEQRLWLSTQYILEFAKLYPDAPITLGIVPGSYSLLFEKAPYALENVDPLPYIQQIYEKLSPSSINALDVYGALSEHAKDDIFYRTDHHWTTYGAYLAYARYITDLGLTPVRFDTLNRHQIKGFLGTYYSKAKRFPVQSDTLTYIDLPPVDVTIDGKPYNGIYDLGKLEQRDKYASFLWGNNGVTVIKRTDSTHENPSRILIIKDSFGNCLAPFFTYNYDEVYVVDLRSTQGIKSVMESQTFDQVLLLYSFDSMASDVNIAKLRY